MTQTAFADLFDPAAKSNPYPIYADLRTSRPVHHVMLPDGSRLWLITRYDDAAHALRDPRLIKGRTIRPVPEDLAPFTKSMLSTDPPDHTRLRGLVHQAFTPRLIERLRPRIQQIADELLDRVEPVGAMDLVEDYAFPLPMTVITELLGVPSQDRDRFREWSNTFVSSGFASQDEPFPEPLRASMTAFSDYLRALFEHKRADPRDDLVSRLVLAEQQDGARCDALSETELIGMVFLLIVAGHETTVNLIGNAVLALLTHPDQLRRLIEDPALIVPAVEELLRYDGPVEIATFRFASVDIELGGVRIPQGDPVLVALASADRDEARFADADRLDITRADNRHLAFGKGIHFCLGAPLARLEGQIAIGTLLRRMPGLRSAVPLDQLEWRPSTILRGLRSFPIVF
jgi:cytochrome P450